MSRFRYLEARECGNSDIASTNATVSDRAKSSPTLQFEETEQDAYRSLRF